MHADRQSRMIDRRRCCSDVAQCRHVTQRTAGISVRNRRPADSRRQGNLAPSPTVHGRRDSPACTGYVAAQVASAYLVFRAEDFCILSLVCYLSRCTVLLSVLSSIILSCGMLLFSRWYWVSVSRMKSRSIGAGMTSCLLNRKQSVTSSSAFHLHVCLSIVSCFDVISCFCFSPVCIAVLFMESVTSVVAHIRQRILSTHNFIHQK